MVPFFREIIFRDGMQLDPQMLCVIMDFPLLKIKEDLQSYLGIMNYLGKDSLVTAEVFKPMSKHTSLRTEWM